MKSIELMKANNVSLVMLLRDDDTIKEYVVCSDYDATEEIYKQWSNGNYYWDLASALENYRTRAKNQPTYFRLNELMGKIIEGILQADYAEWYYYLLGNCNMTEVEMKYFGIKSTNNDEIDF